MSPIHILLLGQRGSPETNSASSNNSTLSASTVITLAIAGAFIAIIISTAVYRLCTHSSASGPAGIPIYNSADLPSNQRERLREVRRLNAVEFEEQGRLARLEVGERLPDIPAAWLPRLRRLTNQANDPDPLFSPQAFNRPIRSETARPSPSPKTINIKSKFNFAVPNNMTANPNRNRNRFSRFSFPFPQLRDSMRASRGDEMDYTHHQHSSEGISGTVVEDWDDDGVDLPLHNTAHAVSRIRAGRGAAAQGRYNDREIVPVVGAGSYGEDYSHGRHRGRMGMGSEPPAFGLPPRSIYSLQASRGPVVTTEKDHGSDMEGTGRGKERGTDGDLGAVGLGVAL